LSDLVIEGRQRLRMACDKCGRIGKYDLASLVVRHGIDKGLPDLLAELSADCPQRDGQGLERCGAVYRPE
jgi:hypothetical protein